MYRNFSSVYRRLYGYGTGDGGNFYNGYSGYNSGNYRPWWRYNYSRPDYSNYWRLWDPNNWVEDTDDVDDDDVTDGGREATPVPRTGTPARTPIPIPETDPEPTTEPEPVPEPATDPEPEPATDPDPEPTTEPEPEPPTDPVPEPPTDPEPVPEPSEPEPAPSTDPEPAPAPSPSPVTDPRPVKKTRILSVDLQTDVNRSDHHTAQYTRPGPIVRRGQTFRLGVKVNQKDWSKDDSILLQLAFGKTPRINYRTLFHVIPSESHDMKEASAVVTDITNDSADDSSSVSLSLNLPCDAPVGEYTLVVRARTKREKGRNYDKRESEQKLVVLFNPWCEDDDVYVSDEAERDEYVMAEHGRIFTSNSLWRPGKPWFFGQFQDQILDAALFLLNIPIGPNKSGLQAQARGNVIRVSRILSAQVNSNDGYGVLSGNWSGDYSGGVSPMEWSGSVAILQQFMDTNQPVNFGQCWVFSGVLTTVCRALGIPTRSVTNFESAHDTDESMTIDTFYDESGDEIRNLNDSVWNFHVWNEGWFKRRDLPEGYDGWQAFDSTPQEKSDWIFQCGPAPLKAIKEGNVHLGYDAKFIFAEVNGDKVTWKKYRDGRLKVTEIYTDDVGKNMSTKKVGDDGRELVTHLYKYKEKTEEEREAVARAVQLGSRRNVLNEHLDYAEHHDVDVTLTPEMTDDATVKATLTAKNTSAEKRTYKGTFSALATYYTGVTADVLKSVKESGVLQPGEEKMFTMELSAEEWINRAAEDATVTVYALLDILETEQRFAKKSALELNKPELEMRLSASEVRVGESVELSMSFTNPLDVELNKGSLRVEGAGFKPITQKTQDVPGKSVMTTTVSVTPTMSGRVTLDATYHSRQLVGIDGSTVLNVVA